ncbi:hypothetical protein N798_15585 [Knoellia flava TL1]|uniref:Peptide O-xylosyltransferase n=2 Tax=Knoellia flava TaxID=913969 RepID=A0A8H9FRF8_9MICO|nr:beta-1,6-N-acetylglucosaminyltransferase [Knoellia flava]KGN29033.1 hypothetical protein N798_15585 [Knoellia flava TL1]GGB70123.1 glycosyl transferase [Knoellia flava]
MTMTAGERGSDRHAFLVAGHENHVVLQRLISLLDDERNDLYVHVNKRAKGFDPDRLQQVCRRSRLVIMPRMSVYWGDYSQITSMLRMMRRADANGPYAYVHLLSDSDLPLKSNDEMHAFFMMHQGREFVAFNELSTFGRTWVALRYPLNRFYRAPNPVVRAAYLRYRNAWVRIQSAAGRDWASQQDVQVKYGSDWASITGDLAHHVISQEPLIRRVLGRAFIPTEFYLQTVVWNSAFRDRVFDHVNPYRSNVRLVDFARGGGDGSPLTWRYEHLSELVSSDRMFARKFDAGTDLRVVEALVAHVRERGSRGRASGCG